MNRDTLCRRCGSTATTTCACGSTMCDRHAHYYVDDANEAVNRGSRAQCAACLPSGHPRPLTLIEAVLHGEWFFELEYLT